MKRLSLFIATLAMGLCFSASVEAKTYINGIDDNYPPFGFVGEDGTPTGFDVDSMDWIAGEMGFEVTHLPMKWDGIVLALLSNKIDMICSGMSISPERAAQVNFSEPYYTVSKVLVTKEESTLTEDDILNGKVKLGVQNGTNEHAKLVEMQEEGNLKYTLRLYDSSPMAVEDLLNGRIDALAIDSAPAKAAMDKGKEIKIVGSFAKDDEFGVAIHKDNAELMEIVNEGYRRLKADPYWAELHAKYL